MNAWAFLAAYACSGLAGLVYEVIWVRSLTLYMGHSTAATSTVVAAFMGGMAAGAAISGRIASRLTPRAALIAYVFLELLVALTALAMPLELRAVAPILAWAYNDGSPGALFPIVRVVLCLAVLLAPTAALGATFPLAIRWFVHRPAHSGESAGRLYAANTAGAALGTLAAGFFLLPAIGVTGTTLVGVAASALAIATVVLLSRSVPEGIEHAERSAKQPERSAKPPERSAKPPERSAKPPERRERRGRPLLAAAVLACTGFATFVYEITWSRVFAALIGPSTYAFAATVSGLIVGLAIGSAIGSAIAGRVRRPELPLALALVAAALGGAWASAYAGGLPMALAQQFGASSGAFGEQLFNHAALAAALVAPAAIGLGMAFPLALEIAGGRENPARAGSDDVVARRAGVVYAINTVAAVAGSLLTGFFFLRILGLQNTLGLAGSILLAAAALVTLVGGLPTGGQVVALATAAIAAGVLLWIPPWDRALLASGGYKYASHVPKGIDLPTALKAGTLLYYREGPAGIVTVKRMIGVLSLAIDGKVDASSGGDMLTQKALAHLPLLLHSHARTICIIGLGSGVTLASALVHPVESVDVVEISPEVVEASRLFAAQNRNAVDDRRTRLILGDGRSHLALANRTYDVIISEPSNPWMAGVAALFTREFFTAARNRLAPGGIICQWAHTYDISEADLRSIVATFAAVFPNGTMWLVGDGDLLLIGSNDPIDERLANIQAGWSAPAVGADLASASMRDPFALLSLYAGGPRQLASYGAGAGQQTDDRMALEFSGPRAINSTGTSNPVAIRHLLSEADRPAAVAQAFAAAGPREWRNRGSMLLAADAYDAAYQDFATAVQLDRTDSGALADLVRAAIASHHEADAATFLKSLAGTDASSASALIALSKLQAAGGDFDQAVASARSAAEVRPINPAALDQLASLYADRGDASGLDPIVDVLQRFFPDRPMTRYYAAASNFMHERLPAALDLAREAVQIDPQHAPSHTLLGAIHASLGQPEQARQAFEDALRLDPRDSATYTNLGLMELSAGNGARAARYFSEALSLDPSSEAARQGLARTAFLREREESDPHP